MVEECEFDEKFIGWMGDRTNKRDPKVVVIDGLDLLWKKVSVFSSEAEYAEFYSDKANRKRFYHPTDKDSLMEFVLPHLLLVPLAMVKWLLSAPRTPWEYHCELLDKLGGAQVTDMPKELDLSIR